MISKYVLLVIFFSFSICVIAQDSLEYKIENIKYSGIEKTKISLLEQNLSIRKGDKFSIKKTETDKQNLKNIAGIGSAELRCDTINKSINLTYNIEEVKTFVAMFDLGGIKDNLWFQLGFTDHNWRGKGHKLSVSYINNDGLHGGRVYFKNPRIVGLSWGYTANLSRWFSLEPLYFSQGTVNYVYENNSLELMAIKNFSLYHHLDFGGSYFIENYKKSDIQFLEDPPGPILLAQPKLLSKVGFNVNRINNDYFYRTGYAWNLTYQNIYNTVDNSIFNSIQYQIIDYLRPTRKINLAFRLRMAISTNNFTPFAPFVADNHVNLRGVGNRIDRGTAQIVLNIEYRHTIFDRKVFAGQVVAFSDIGTWRGPGGGLSDFLDSQQVRHFVGGGIRIVYQKVFGSVIRIDYGIDIYNPSQKGLVIGLGQYF